MYYLIENHFVNDILYYSYNLTIMTAENLVLISIKQILFKSQSQC